MTDGKGAIKVAGSSFWTVGRKLAAIVVCSVGLGFSGIIAAETYWSAREHYDLVLRSDLTITRMLASQLSSSIRWQRPEVIKRRIAGLTEDPDSAIDSLMAFNAEGEVLVIYQAEGSESADLRAALTQAGDQIEKDRVFSRRTPTQFIVVAPVAVDAPSSLGVEHVRVGALAVAWSLAEPTNQLRTGFIRQLVLGVVALILLIVVCIEFLKRFVSRPLEALTRVTARLAYGDTKLEVPGTERRDELGGLARAVEVFKRNVSVIERMTIDQQKHATRLSKALEKEREYNALQSEFVAMASHEFRTPLAIIDGTAQRIERRIHQMPEEDLLQRIQKIRHAVKRMLALIESTLSASRLEAGEVELEVDACDLAAIVAEVCRRQQELSAFHTIVVEQGPLPREIAADAKKLEQIFANLLSNAVKYAPDNPRIEVRLAKLDGQAVVSVRDRGLGIPVDDIPRLFQRYFRARTATGIAGTGIGLNLAKRFVELHGGTIEVESVEGEGTTFTVRLPIKELPGSLARHDIEALKKNVPHDLDREGGAMGTAQRAQR